jgi:hypothetical protein
MPSRAQVDLAALPMGTLTDPTVARDAVQGVFGGRFVSASYQQLGWEFAAAPDGAEFVVWVWTDNGSTSHMVYGRKAAGRMEFYDQRGRLTEEEAHAELANTRLVLRRGSPGSGRDVDVTGVNPVGAIERRASPGRDMQEAPQPADPGARDRSGGADDLLPPHQAPPGIGERFGPGRDHPSDRNERPPPVGVDARDSRLARELPETSSRGAGSREVDEPEAERAGSPALPPPPDRHDDSGSPTGDRRSGPPWPAGSIFDELAAEIRLIRSAPVTERANKTTRNGWPRRSVSTGRVFGTVNGRLIEQKIAVTSGQERFLKGTAGEHLPVLPPEGHRIFKTSEIGGRPHTFDSEVKVLEELARDILEAGSGKSRKEVESAIEIAIKRAPEADGYPEDAKIVIDDAAEQLGVDLDDIDVQVLMMLDYPKGRQEAHPLRQICDSCQNAMTEFLRAFRTKVDVTVRNPDGETLWDDEVQANRGAW